VQKAVYFTAWTQTPNYFFARPLGCVLETTSNLYVYVGVCSLFHLIITSLYIEK
jgi:hypothetical protein